ncbi:MAG: hypothetical protein P4L67_04190 [Candidatus Pacebacteria bacterium]|nr:hypothetical protein [Candidatus Paceibacterota bacterium]
MISTYYCKTDEGRAGRYFETTQVKDHDKSYINVLVSKAKDQVGSLDIFLVLSAPDHML